MRLIDADALTRRWCGIKCGCEREECGREIEPCIVVMAIEDAPTIDAVEVVRCKDCRWSEPNEFGDYDCRCHIPIFRVNDDGYCSYGERKESE